MGLLNKILNRPLSCDQFAKMFIKRLRESGETAPIAYDPAQFQLSKSNTGAFYLSNAYQQYLRVSKAEQELVIRSFLTTWHTLGLQAPEDFNDAKADLMPALRARAYLEIDLHRIANDYRSQVDFPYGVVADHLIATLVYDLPQSMMSVNQEQLDDWGVTYYEAMEIAKQNLRETTTQYAQFGSLYAVAVGDSYDATRLLLTDLLQSLNVQGDVIAMVPNRESLYVTGSDDVEGLGAMVKLAAEDLQHERNISGLAFRLAGDEWETWMPADEHPHFNEFQKLRVQSIGQIYAEQKHLLELRQQQDGSHVFVASLSAMQNDKTGRITSCSTWSDGVDTLLPQTDHLYLVRPEAPQNELVAAFADWTRVLQIAGDLMEPQGMYPERWRVREFPSVRMLREIGILPDE